MKERGGIPLAVLIGVGIILFVIIAMAVCTDAIFEDEDEANDLGQGVELVAGGGGRGGDCDGDRSCESRPGSDDCKDSTGHCEDNDASPSFQDSPVILCLPGSTCHF